MRNTLQGHSDFMNKIEIVGGSYHIETSQLICRANQRTSFYMIDLHHQKVESELKLILLIFLFVAGRGGHVRGRRGF